MHKFFELKLDEIVSSGLIQYKPNSTIFGSGLARCQPPPPIHKTTTTKHPNSPSLGVCLSWPPSSHLLLQSSRQHIRATCQTPQLGNPSKPRHLPNSLSRSHQDALFFHLKFSSRRAVSRVAAPRTMPCLLLPAPPLHPRLIDSVSRPPLPRYRFFLPLTRRRPPSLRLGVRMAEMTRVGSGGEPPEVGVSMESDPFVGGEAPSHPRWEESRWAPVEAALNRMSKWLVSGSFAFAAIWKHDAEIMWVLLGAVGNSLLSIVLKMMLNHERPEPALRSDPGMPSSHAQSIFFAATLLALSLYYWLGTNYVTMILGPATLSVAAYLSWLRVSQRLHTLNQVTVGAVVGSAFGALWFVLWHSLVQEAFASSLLVRIVVILGSSTFCVSFVIYMISHWLKDE